jgi:hypothetical protein
MDVQTMLAMIIGIVSRAVMGVLTITMVGTAKLVTMVNRADVVMVVGMYEQAGQHARQGGVSHAHAWPQGKPEGRGPNEDLAASA